MKIFQINKFYYPYIGGIEKAVQEIAEGVKDKAEVKVLVCQPRGKTKIELINRVKVIKSGSIGTFFSMPVSLRFFFWFKEFSTWSDVFHLHLPFPLGVIAALLTPSIFKKKVVCTFHSEIIKQQFFLPFYKPLLKKFLRKVNEIIVTSPNLLNSSKILEEFRKKCIVVPLGIDPDEFELTNGIKKIKEKIKEIYPGNLILFVGRLSYYKGLPYLLTAMQKINAHLFIIGEGKLKKYLLNLAYKNLKLKNVTFLGKISQKEMIAFYHVCDIFVLPSIERTEAFGLVLLEAMACGKPVVSTNLATGVPFVNLHEKTGLVVPPRDPEALAQAINKLLNEPILREKYGKNGEERVEKEFTKETMIKKIFNLYREVLNS